MSGYLYHSDGSAPSNDEIFVFGSNLAGRHGAGAAKFAFDRLNAVWGIASGMTGRAYAIPTKDQFIETMALYKIEPHIQSFLQFAWKNPELKFFMTRIGCVLAGYKDSDIAPFFKDAPTNINFPESWRQYVEHN